MSIQYVILGFLSEASLTGYDLKKKFSDSELFPWSGNNNQIYRTLLELHEGNLVTIEVQYQESKPPRKIYTITDAGRAALRQWMVMTPELPQFRSQLLVQLNWAEQLDPHELDKMLARYEEDLRVYVLMLREQSHRNAGSAFTTRIADHWIALYQLELDWVHALRQSFDNSQTRKEKS